ncbi:hypothetical protein ABIA30_003025 [Mycobacterium sp. MAA66]|uniref:DUF4185 domain-containing protein n=1 Tax=Mycobacterium sp. MAA66 TaxID=3156297 RepID=UPI0035134EDD
MGAAAYIGRVGGLAVALGVGTAIATGHGTAWADESGGPAGHTSTQSDTSAGPKKPRPKKTKTPQAPASKADDSKVAVDDRPARNPKPVWKNKNTNPATRPSAAEPATPDPTPPPKPTLKPSAKPAANTPAAIKPAAAAPLIRTQVAAAATALAGTSSTPAAVNPVQTVVKVVGEVLNWAFNPTPANPAHPTLAWAILAFARREIDNVVAALKPRPKAATAGVAVDTTSLALPATATATANAAQPGFPTPGQKLGASTSFVNWITGNFPPNDTYNRFGVWGTDVGTMWDNGIADDPSTPINEHQVLMAFGDTFSGPNMTGTWRNNVLARSSDTNLADGITIGAGQWLNGNMFGGMPLSQQNYARQIILPERLPSGLPTGVTLIPTAGISVPTPGTEFGATQYLSFMSVKQWGSPGQWSTNYSAIAYSVDNGENWYVAPSSVRQNSPFSGNKNFQQSAFVRPGDGYVYAYAYGTPNGRGGSAYLSRVAESAILDASKYQYYSKGSAGFFGFGAYKAGWYNDPAKASAVFGNSGGACGVTQPGNHVSELSVQYNATLGKYVTLYGDQFNNIVMRTSDTPQGKWSAATVLLTQQNGGIYAPMMDPWSPSTLGTGTDLYWNLSLWSQYNVMLMKTDLTKV